MTQPMLLNLTGHDQPGVTARLFAALPSDLEVLDVEQVVVDGLLTLGVLIKMPKDSDTSALQKRIKEILQPIGISVSFAVGHPDIQSEIANIQTITVIGRPLTAQQMANVSDAIAVAGANIDRIERIAAFPVTALELHVSGSEVALLRKSLAHLSVTANIDIAVQAGSIQRRGRHLVVMDVDSTVIQDEVIELLAAEAGVLSQVSEITNRAMHGELDFSESLRQRAALLQGLPESVFTEVYQQVRLTPGARTLCQVLHSMDYQIALVSGGFSQVVAPLADQLGVELWAANELEVKHGLLTGQVKGQIIDRAGKAFWLREFAERTGISIDRTIAIGDGANDLDMLAEASLGIAFNAKPVVQASADAALNVPYLDTVLYLLGISRAEVEQVARTKN